MSNLFKENRLKQDDVDSACLAVMQRGERVSTTTIHKEVGERGSFSTIQKMVKDWQSRNPVESERVENLPLKADMPESLKVVSDNALKAVWYQARELAHNELEVQRESLRKAEEDINLKIAELQEFSDNQTNTIEVLREQLAEVTAKSSELDQLLTTEHATTSALTEKLNQALHDLELSGIDNQTLTQRLAESKESHDKQVSELKADIVKRDADSDKLRSDFDKRIKTSEESVKSLDKQVTKLQTALDVQDKQITEAKTERAAALTAEKLALEKAAALSGQLTQVLKELKEFQDKAKVTENVEKKYYPTSLKKQIKRMAKEKYEALKDDASLDEKIRTKLASLSGAFSEKLYLELIEMGLLQPIVENAG
jgi:chromosome segregation ATPase